MTTIGERIDEETKKKLGLTSNSPNKKSTTSKKRKSKVKTTREIKVKDIYLIYANEENDITPKIGNYRKKYFIVMGINDEGDLYGCVVFDSEINPEYVRREEYEFFLDIPKSSYDFLIKDSKVDCRKLKPAKKQKLLEGKFIGIIHDKDYEKLKSLILASPRNSYIELKLFHLK